MSVQAVVYKGYVHTIRSEPGYTNQVNVRSQSEAGLALPSEPERPRSMDRDLTARNQHVQPARDLWSEGNYQYLAVKWLDWVQTVLAAEKISEAARKGIVNENEPRLPEDTFSSDQDRVLDGTQLEMTDTTDVRDLEQVAAGDLSFDSETHVAAVNQDYVRANAISTQATDWLPESERALMMTGPYVYHSWIDTGQVDNVQVSLTAIDYGRDVGHTLDAGRLVPEPGNTEYGIYTTSEPERLRERVETALDVLPPHWTIGAEPGAVHAGALGDELRSVAGVEMVWPKAGAVLVDQPPMARVGFFIYEWDWGGGWTEPRSDLNGRPSRIPPPSRQVESDEQRLGRKKLWPINREPHTQGVGDIRYSSVELEPTSLMIESKDLRTMTRPETPLGSLDSHTKAVQTSPHVVEQNFEGLNFNAEPVILSRMLGRTSREPFVDRVEAGERAVNLRPELSIRNPEIPSEPSTARYTGEHPFDYNSHYQTYLQAHQVMDPATDFRKTEHQEETRRLGPAPPHERIHKITQKDFIDRADPRIQEVIMAKERVDTFGLVKAVQFEGRAAEGSPTYNDHGQAIHFATKGTLVDTLAVDWAGPHSER